MPATLGDASIEPAPAPELSRKILFSVTVYQPRSGFAFCLAASVIATALLLSRNPDHLLHPQLWAEDGRVWLDQAYTYGAASLAWPHSGYLQSLPRLTALGALFLPFTAIPLAFVIVSLSIQMLPAVLLLSGRAASLIPSSSLRLILVAYYIGEPNSPEVYLNLTNAMWHLAFAAILMLILPKPQARGLVWLDVLILLLSGFSGPFALCMLPVAWWQALRNRNGILREWRLARHYAGIVSLCAAVQAGCVLTNGSQRIGNLAPSYTRLVHIIANQVILGGLLGARNVGWLYFQPFWQSAILPSLVCAGALGMAGFALRYGPPAYRQFMLFCCLIMISALFSPIISASNQWYFMQYPGLGDRYYIFPMLAWFLTIVVLAHALGRRLGRNWPYVLALCPFLIGILPDWHYPNLAETGYHAAAAQFDAAPPGTKVTFSANPPAPIWQFTLTKK